MGEVTPQLRGRCEPNSTRSSRHQLDTSEPPEGLHGRKKGDRCKSGKDSCA